MENKFYSACGHYPTWRLLSEDVRTLFLVKEIAFSTSCHVRITCPYEMNQGRLSTFLLYKQVSGLDARRETVDVLEWNKSRAR
jgi:hypothetical protein